MSSSLQIPVCGYRASVAVHAAADRSAPTILALHGFTGSGADFDEVRHALGADKATWICPDFMGHGDSDSPYVVDPYCIPATVDLIDKARHLAVDPQRVILVAYSMGARIALHYLLRALPLPALLISCSPGLAGAAERAHRRAADQRWISLLQDSGIEAFAREWERQSLIEPQTRLREPLRTALAERRRTNNPAGLVHSLLGCGTGALPSLWDKLQLLPPVTLTYGRLDRKFEGIAHAMAQKNDGFYLSETPVSGHAPHLESPREIARLLKDMLRARA